MNSHLVLFWLLSLTVAFYGTRAKPPLTTEVPDVSQWQLPEPAPPVNCAKWMEEQWDVISNLTLKDITLPGTHDSGSWSVTDDLLGTSPWIQALVKVADFLHLPVGTIIDWWSKTQTQNFFDQFSGGIRYVDVRVIYDPYKGYWRTHHSFVLGTKLEILLEHTREFLQQNTKEVIVLELSHESSVNVTIQQELVDMILNYLGPHLWPQSKGFVTLQEMINSGNNVILTLPFGNEVDGIWPDGTIINSYADSAELSKMEEYNLDQVTQFASNKPGPLNLFKMSWTLTADENTILESILPIGGHPHTLLQLAHVANNDLANWFNTSIVPKGLKYPILGNILIIDDYSTSPIIDIVTRGR
eukprot:TRINITY_DN1088_c0_g2_i3.p1 TRINITY_DN1088_c0_g2~~TRINITY_DN1088_c0_g2_i3.p1  ORF type:complete len:357 (-),score=46.37 TRINITY_DN1088_c0_g2_i3:113-1183(-)